MEIIMIIILVCVGIAIIVCIESLMGGYRRENKLISFANTLFADLSDYRTRDLRYVVCGQVLNFNKSALQKAPSIVKIGNYTLKCCYTGAEKFMAISIELFHDGDCDLIAIHPIAPDSTKDHNLIHRRFVSFNL